MLAILLNNGIGASTVNAGDEGLILQVGEDNIAQAINLLGDHGYPREKRETLGEVFKKSGIMSSPFEEHIRFIYALSEEVSKTLSQLDGVTSARVHIVLPEEASFEQTVQPSSAAVFIKYRAGIDLDFFTPQIKRLVSSSIEGVSYEDVTVIMMEATVNHDILTKTKIKSEPFLGLELKAEDKSTLLLYASLAGGLLLILLIGFGLLIWWCFKLSNQNKALSYANSTNETPTVEQ